MSINFTGILKTTVILALFCFPVASNAQIFWEEDFSEGIPTEWTNEDAALNIDTVSFDTVRVVWEHCDDPASCVPAEFGLDAFASATADNGYAYVDSDQWGGDYVGLHMSQLTTAVINCSDKDSVYINFDSHIGTFAYNANDNAILRVWTNNNGWTDYNIYPELTADNGQSFSSNPRTIIVNLSDVASNTDSVRLQWQWTGFYEYSWAIDDIVLTSEDPTPPPELPEGVIWIENFDGDADGWTVNSPSIDTAVWTWDLTGDVGNGALAGAGTRIQCSNEINGSMVFNADFYTTGGTDDGIPTGPAETYPKYVAELISPVIDLSGVETSVSLQFCELVRFLNVSPAAPQVQASGDSYQTSVQISLDGGDNWSDPINANSNLENNADPYSEVETIAMPGLQGQSNVRIKFVFSSDFYYWVLDDIAIIERGEHDMKANTNFFAIHPNAATPVSMVEDVPFLADIQNNGGFTETNVEYNLSISNPGGAEIYNSSNIYASIGPDSIAENVIFPNMLLANDILDLGVYNGKYELSMDSTDAKPDDNIINWSFEISDTTFAKETGFTRNVSPSAEPTFTYGNCFYIPVDGYYARYVTFGVANPEELVGRSVTTLLYEWDGDTDGNGAADPDEYGGFPIAFNSYTFSTEQSNELITIPVEVDSEPISLKAGKYYLMMIQYVTDDEQSCYLLASEAYDYSAMQYVTDSLQQPRYAALLDVGTTTVDAEFSITGFGLDLVPLVRLHIGDEPIQTDTKEQVLSESALRIFPNPSKGIFNIEWKLQSTSSVAVSIYDTRARLLKYEEFDDQLNGNSKFDLNSFASGTYFVRVVTDEGVRTERLFIQ
ncbi:MAG: T9SS type A sorting domain-containing protein [Bacteroidetes bacterium]|nr:T9SS type A sorting domain-containing protein [Bacteroidota bacterium]